MPAPAPAVTSLTEPISSRLSLHSWCNCFLPPGAETLAPYMRGLISADSLNRLYAGNWMVMAPLALTVPLAFLTNIAAVSNGTSETVRLLMYMQTSLIFHDVCRWVTSQRSWGTTKGAYETSRRQA